MHDFSIHSRWRSMADASSESKPTMKPADTSSPLRASLFTASCRSTARFCALWVSRRASVDGVSMPTNTESKPAHTIALISSSETARLMLASE